MVKASKDSLRALAREVDIMKDIQTMPHNKG